MPSPVGHALAGLAAGSLAFRVRDWRVLAVCATAGMLADVDFLLPLPHRGPSHSLAAGAMVFVIVLMACGLTMPLLARLRLAAAIGLAYLSHPLLDWLGEDTWSPTGVMVLWPCSHHYYVSGLDVFNAVNRHYWMPGFWRDNTIAVMREVAIMGPVAVVSTYRIRARTSVQGGPPRPSA